MKQTKTHNIHNSTQNTNKQQKQNITDKTKTSYAEQTKHENNAQTEQIK